MPFHYSWVSSKRPRDKRIYATVIGLLLFLLPSGWSEAATFGNTTIGGTQFEMASNDESDSTHSVLGSDGTVTDVSFYGRKDTTNREMRGGIYLVSGAAFQGGGSEVVINSATPQWWTLSGLSVSVTATNYYVAFLLNGHATDNVSYYYDTVASANRISAGGLSYPTWPDPGSVISSARKISIYATYTASGGGGSTPSTDDGIIWFN